MHSSPYDFCECIQFSALIIVESDNSSKWITSCSVSLGLQPREEWSRCKVASETGNGQITCRLEYMIQNLGTIQQLDFGNFKSWRILKVITVSLSS